MRLLESGLYCASFAGLACGLWLVVKSGRRITRSLTVATAAGSGAAPPGVGAAIYQLNPESWGPTAASHLAEAAEAAQASQTQAAWIAFVAGTAGLAATLMTIWT